MKTKMAARGTNISLASELMQLIDEEEYVQAIPTFRNDDYLNKNEVCSLKKMTSGKLWVDNRKFVTRQNTPIASGLFEMIGASVSKSASDTKAEVCDFLLDPDNKNLRSIIKSSLKDMDISYDKWIAKLSDMHPPCDSVVLYLLCKTYKRHAVVLTSSKIWSTFKAGNRTPLDMFVKADFVLLWLGDNRFAEIKPLKTVTNTLGSLVEWQQLTDSIHVIQDKRRTEKRARKPRQPQQPKSPPKTKSPEVSTPRKGRKRQSKVQIDYKSMHNKGLIVKSPKQRKILPKASGPSESRIESQRMITRELLQKQTKAKGYETTAKIIGTCIKEEKKDSKPLIKIELKRECDSKQDALKRIKIEASEIHMVHRTNPADSAKTWNYIHPSGSPCGRKHRLIGNLRADELPDLIPTDTTYRCAESVSTPHSSNIAADDTGKPTPPSTTKLLPVSTPPATVQQSEIDEPIANREDNEQNSAQDITQSELNVGTTTDRVSTPQTNPVDPTPGGSTALDLHTQESTVVNVPTLTRTVPPTVTRVQYESTLTTSQEAEIQTAKTLLELHETLDLPEDNLLAEYDNADIMPVNAPPLPDYSKDHPLPVSNDPNDTDATIEYSDENPKTGNDASDLPNLPDSHVDEEHGEQSPPGKFNFRHHGIRRNLGSPKAKTKRFQCIYCPIITDSKREMNAHHRSSHGIMTCVDCGKTFPTPDALQRHRYIHQQNHEQFKCEICDYITAFESDMKRHKIQHVDEKMWDCTDPACDRSFKRKSDMISHAKTHDNDDQRCPAQGCNYSNKDPRNLKRHMKCHSNIKPLKCPVCPERFKHYQQLKRHKENHP